MDENKLLDCVGTVAWRDHSRELGFDIAVAANGSIFIDLGSRALTSDNLWLHKAHLQKSPTVELLSLEGYTQDRYRITSDSIHLTECGISSTPTSVTLTARSTASRLIIQNAEAIGSSGAVWKVGSYVSGFRRFGPVGGQDAIGRIAVAAGAQVEDHQRINGLVTVNATLKDGQNRGSWLSAVEQKTRRILDILSFADGHFLRTSIRKMFRNGKLHTINLEGARPTSQPYKPPFRICNSTQCSR
jgi:hypothetical protein